MTVVPFEPRTRVEFEGHALRRLTLMAATAIRTPEMMGVGQDASNNPMLGMVQKLVEAMAVLDDAISTVESCSDSLIADAEPGVVQVLETESSKHEFRVTMRAVIRCDIIYIGAFQFQRIGAVEAAPVRKFGT